MQEEPISAEISRNRIADNAECGIFAPGVVILTGSDNELFNNPKGDLCGHIPADTTLISPREQRTLRVPEDYETLQAAIDAAGLRDIVALAPAVMR